MTAPMSMESTVIIMSVASKLEPACSSIICWKRPSAVSTPFCRVLGRSFFPSPRCFFRPMRCIALKKRLDL